MPSDGTGNTRGGRQPRKTWGQTLRFRLRFLAIPALGIVLVSRLAPVVPGPGMEHSARQVESSQPPARLEGVRAERASAANSDGPNHNLAPTVQERALPGGPELGRALSPAEPLTEPVVLSQSLLLAGDREVEPTPAVTLTDQLEFPVGDGVLPTASESTEGAVTVQEQDRLTTLPGACLSTRPIRGAVHLGFDAHFPYHEWAATAQDERLQVPGLTLSAPLRAVPPWWRNRLVEPLRPAAKVQAVRVDDLILSALEHSPKVRAISSLPLISEQAIVQAEASFDVRGFVESRFKDTNEPVGSTLITGGAPRFLDQDYDSSAGLRKKTAGGGTIELAQHLGYQDNNSRFFVPTQQGTARLALSFRQPLLNGSGRAYNRSLIVLAEIDADIAWREFSQELQAHLLEVTRAYWELYLQRAVLLQKRQLYEQAGEILSHLESRQGFDTLESQLVRARSAVARRAADIVRAEMAIRNAESRLRSLVNAPFLMPHELELVPLDAPALESHPVRMRDAMLSALEYRPDIDQAMQAIRAAQVRLQLSEKELLPVLDFVVEAYTSGLQGDVEIERAWTDQFSIGRPSYSVGLLFEIPLGNRAAKARHQQRRLELEQLQNRFQQVVETALADVQIAVREVETTRAEREGRLRSLAAAEAEVSYLYERWRLLPGEDRATSYALEDLLEAQERLAHEEFEFVNAEVAHILAHANLKRVTGTLLTYQEALPAGGDSPASLPSNVLEKIPLDAADPLRATPATAAPR